MERNVVCDSSALISLADTCNIGALKHITKEAGIGFLVTPAVKMEIISRPLTIRKYAFSAVRLQKVLNDNVLSMITSEQLHDKTQRVLELANGLIRVDKKPIELVQIGEAECVAIFSSASAQALLIDEKTTRLLIENPYRLRETIEAEYGHSEVSIDHDSLEEFASITKGITCMRSCELLAYAYKKGFFDEYGDKKEEAFKAAIFSVREAGCGMTSAEMAEYEKMEF